MDLNADLGEGDAYDFELLQVVSSCNIACGGHAGDADSMLATLRLALANGVSIGAHPAYPDRAAKGRRSGFLKGAELRSSLVEQLQSLSDLATSLGAKLQHVKPHGALYQDAARDQALAQLFAEVAEQAVPGCALVGAPGSWLQRVAEQAGTRFVAEGFVDRAYLPDGGLVPRGTPGAVHAELNTITAQAVSIACRQQVTAQDGSVIAVPAATLCIHGDTANAGIAARAVRDVLEANGVQIRAAN